MEQELGLKRRIKSYGYEILRGHQDGDDHEINGHISQSSINRSGFEV